MPYAGKHHLGTARDGSSDPEVPADVTAGPADASPGGAEAGVVPVLAPGVELVGEYQGSGLTQVTFLARNASGRVVQLSRLLWLVLSGIDGSRTVGEIAARVSVEFGRTVSAGNVEYLLQNKLTPLGLVAGGDDTAEAATAGPDAAILALAAARDADPGGRGPGRGAAVRAAVPPAGGGGGPGVAGRGGCVAGAVRRAAGRVRRCAGPPAAAAGPGGLVGGVDGVPRVRARGGVPVRRGAPGPDRHGPVCAVAGPVHQRHRFLPAGAGRPDPDRPGRGVLQRGLRGGAGGRLPKDRLPAAGGGGAAGPAGAGAAAAALTATRRVLHPDRPGRGAGPVPADRAGAAQPGPGPSGPIPGWASCGGPPGSPSPRGWW